MKTGIKRNQLRIVANLIYTGLVLLIICSETTMADEPWKTLFDGESLQGWVQRGGKARYTAEDGQIIGTTVFRTPNSFLCTQVQSRRNLEFRDSNTKQQLPGIPQGRGTWIPD